MKNVGILKGKLYITSQLSFVDGLGIALNKVTLLHSMLLYLENRITNKTLFYSILHELHNTREREHRHQRFRESDIHFVYSKVRRSIDSLPRPKIRIYQSHYRLFFETLRMCYKITLRIMRRSKGVYLNSHQRVTRGLYQIWEKLHEELLEESVEKLQEGLLAEKEYLVTR